MRRLTVFGIVSLALLAAGSAHAQSPFLSAYATCAPPDSFYVIWTTYDPNADPYAYPNWVGYDVLRRALPGCGSYETVNADLIPRHFGTMTHYFGGVSPSPATEYEYIVRPVDADHQLVSIPGFCASCVAYGSCQPLTTPFTTGTIYDVSGMLFVNPCPGTCEPAAYLTGPHAEELRPYAGSSTTVRLFGVANCGTVEGCALDLEHWEIGPCSGVVPTARPSWGRIKTIYR